MKVSCICVTKDRRIFLHKAIEYWRRSLHHHHSELIIIDGSARVSHLPTDVKYIRSPAKPGLARNIACDMATGDILIHWDDDDWQSPERVAKQVEGLKAADICYTSKFYHYDITTGQSLQSRTWANGGGAMGALFAYPKEVWKANPFDNNAEAGEDSIFLSSLFAKKCAVSDLLDPTLLVYMRHNRTKIYEHAFVKDVNVRTIIGDNDMSFYDDLTEILPVVQRVHQTQLPGYMRNEWGHRR